MSIDDMDLKIVDPSTHHQIGLLKATSYVVGSIIGSGIFVSPTSVLKKSGSIGWSLIVWVVSGVISMLGGLVYIELGTSIRKSGCDFAYLDHVGWNAIASTFLFVNVGLLGPATLAIQTLAFGEYFVQGIGNFMKPSISEDVLARAIGFGVLVPLTVINLYSLKKSGSTFQVIITSAKLTVVVIIVLTGLWFICVNGRTENFQDPFAGRPISSGNLVLAVYSGLFAYDGFDMLNYFVEEVENPHFVLPIAATVGIIISGAAYLLMNIAYFSVLSVEQFESSDTVAADFASATLGGVSYFIPFAIAFLLLGNLNTTLLGCSRILLTGAKRGVMPPVFSCIHQASGSPRIAVLYFSATAFLISFIGNLEQLLHYMSYGLFMQRALVQLALIKMRLRPQNYPVPSDAFQLPLVFPVMFFLVCVGLLVIPLIGECTVAFYAIGFVLCGLAIYGIFIVPKQLPKCLGTMNERSLEIVYKLFDVVPM